MKVFALTLLALCPSLSLAQSSNLTDRGNQPNQIEQAVYSAAEDYLLAFYDVEPERLERSLHPDVQKVGFWRNGDEYTYTTMTYDEAIELAGHFNANDQIPDDAPKSVEVLHVHDMTAIAKVTAVWGIDYLQIGNFDGTWKIINVIWQSAPPHSSN
ncbi:MAG: nuclear transport factor 2 family protein [Rubricoccaceae bacterium]|nr:nuclear transport factor 2 family protein [Rubricoccaceae bacterium]